MRFNPLLSTAALTIAISLPGAAAFADCANHTAGINDQMAGEQSTVDMAQSTYPMDVGDPEVAPGQENGGDQSSTSALEVPEYSTEPEAPATAPKGRDDDDNQLEGSAMPVPDYPQKPSEPETSPSG